MKKLILLLMVLLSVGLLNAQIPKAHLEQVVINNGVHLSSTADTAAVVSWVGGYSLVSVKVVSLDSTNIAMQFQKRTPGLAAWTAITAAAGDTVVGLSNSGQIAHVMLRNEATDRFGSASGPSTQLRVVAKALTNNAGATATTTYTVTVEASK